MSTVLFSLRSTWRTLLVWCLALMAVASLYLSFFPSMKDSLAAKSQLLTSLPEGLRKALNMEDLATGTSYVQTTFFGLLGFVLLAVAATTWGARAIAAPEERTELELVIAHGISRTSLYLQQWAALLVRILACMLAAFAVVAIWDAAVDLGIRSEHLLAEVCAFGGVGALIATASLAVGGATGRPAWATGAGAILAAGAFVLDVIGSQGERWQLLQDLSPLHWAYGSTPLVHGFDAGGLALLSGSALVIGLLGLARFRTRDLGR